MYHAEREIRDRAILKAILDMCKVINIGFFDDEYPYVLPVNFGYEFEDDLIFYTHHAVDGYKNKLITKNPKVCVVTHQFIDHAKFAHHDSEHDYRSVMAFGEFQIIPRESEDYAKAWTSLTRCNGREVPDVVYTPGYKIMMGKIVCPPENVIGKAQRKLTSKEQVPFEYDLI
jgi:nitroimidazol reductase NimA-like FMN-containing flavoprotein (pyridoxamine 5'-phosphate oxidase superfamily)